MKKILPILIAFVFLVTFSKSAFAAELELKKIGPTDVTGQNFTTWTYYGLNPVFAGSADPSESIIISIDGEETATTSGTDGAWTATPVGLSAYGIYEVEISTEVDNILFSLTLASSDTAKGGGGDSGDSTAAAATSLPQSGSSDLFIFAGLGTLFLAAAAASKYVFSWYE